MPSKPLAAKASVFNGNFVDDVASTVATEPDFTDSHRDRFYNDFSKMLAQGIVGLLLSCSMATSWAWRMHLGFVRTSPAKEMSSTRLRQGHRHQPLLRQQQGRMVPAPPTSLPRLPPLRVPKLAPAILRPSTRRRGRRARHCDLLLVRPPQR